MPSPLLTFFKYLFLVVLYLFFLRVLRAVWVELREPKVVEATRAPSAVAPVVPVGIGAPATAGAVGAASAAETTFTPLATAGATHARLVVTDPAALAGERFDLADELTIGRSPGCAVSLPDDTYVSSVHARVFRRNGQYLVEDLGSTNGTYLDDVRVGPPAVLRPGARLLVGRTTLELSP